jgi:hypothetical protein
LLRMRHHVLDFPEPILDVLPEYSYLAHIGRRRSSDYEIYAALSNKAL